MLKKLLKYDLQNMLPFLAIFYSLSLVFAVLTRILLNIENSLFWDIAGRICSGVTISMLFNIIINVVMRAWVRFKHNFYGDESYLTHSLPVTKHALYLSKFLTTVIALFLSVLIAVLTLFIAYWSQERYEMLKAVFTTVSAVMGEKFWLTLTVLIVLLFVEFANILQCGFTGIILGHKMRSGKTGFSVLFGFAVYGVGQAVVTLLQLLYALFDSDVMKVFTTNDASQLSSDTMFTLLAVSAAAYAIVLAIGYVVNVKLFQKGVNVD